jgi:RNA polymerase sigma-70 factor (ECF subfamily)
MSDRHKLSLSDFSKLFNKNYSSLCLFALKYVENLDVSKDLVQDVFIKIWEDSIEFKSENSVKSFLYTAVRNKCMDHLKSKSVRTKVPLDPRQMEILDSDSFFLREVVVQESAAIIEKAINSLPIRCSEIVRLSAKGLTNDHIAEVLGLSVNTVKTQKRIAYSRMRPLLRDFFYFCFFITGQ